MAKKHQGGKSRELRNAHGKQHRGCRSLAWNNTFISTLGPLPNSIQQRYITDIAKTEKKGRKTNALFLSYQLGKW